MDASPCDRKHTGKVAKPGGGKLNILAFVPYVLLSVLASSFVILLKPRIPALLLGAIVVSSAAIVIETWVLNFVSGTLLLLIYAPIIEELLKFAATRYKRDLRSALGVGSGFAIAENALYFVTLASIYSLPVALPFILARAVGDPLLHSASTSISVKTWRGKKLAIPEAIGLHFLYNLFAVAMAAYPSLFKFYPLVILGIVFILARERVRSRKAIIAAAALGVGK